MADKKISQLTDLPAASVSPSNDVLAIVDTNVTETKKITAKALVDGALNAGTANGLVYLNGSKETTTGSIITYDGTTFKVDDAVVINESGGDNDTRIEGDNDANLFFVDASTDRIGVGTNSPANKLDVEGAGKFSISTGVGVITNRNAILAASDTAGQLIFQGGSTASATAGLEYARINTTADDATSGSHDGSLNFFTTTNGTSSIKAKLDSSGNLGLGVTPSAWGTGKALEIGALGNALWGGASYTSLSQNAYYDGANYKYARSTSAARFDVELNAFKWWNAASGTAGNTITFTQAMTLDANRRLFLNTTSDVGGHQMIIGFDSSGTYTQAINTKDTNASANNNSHIVLRRSDDTYLGALGRAGTDTAMFVDGNSYLALRTGGTERARITSGGNWLIGTTSEGGNGFTLYPTGSGGGVYTIYNRPATANTTTALSFQDGGTPQGSITYTNAATAFNTSSDRRLKSNIASADEAGSVIDAIEIVKHDWKVGGHVRYGVIAQDLHKVAPEAVSVGDADDAEEFKNPWGVDYSKLVPMLIKEVQSLRKRVAELEAE